MPSRNRNKANGTKHESWLVKMLRARNYEARRLAEGGTADEGDVEAWLPTGRWVLEAKARTALNVQETLGQARAKANAHAPEGVTIPVAVVWKRLVRVPGLQVRQPVAGERVVVTLSLADFLDLLDAAQQTKPEEPDGDS